MIFRIVVLHDVMIDVGFMFEVDLRFKDEYWMEVVVICFVVVECVFIFVWIEYSFCI
jgi:hypothetical protein